MAAAAINAIVSRWFSRRRAAALAIAYNGASIGGVVFSPLWSLLIGGVGFPAAAIWVGVAMVLVVWLLAGRYFAVTPEQVGQGVDGVAAVGVSGSGSGSGSGPEPEPEPALPRTVLRRDRRFLTLAAGMALALFAQIGLLAHLHSLLVPVIGAKGAGFAMAGATAMAIAGRTTVGWLPPVGADRRLAACASLLVQIGGSLVLMLAGGSAAGWLLAGVALFGLGIGNATSLPPLIAQAEFAKADAARVVPFIVAIGLGFYAFAPAAFGLVLAMGPATGVTLFAAAAAVQAVSVAVYLAGRGSGWRGESAGKAGF